MTRLIVGSMFFAASLASGGCGGVTAASPDGPAGHAGASGAGAAGVGGAAGVAGGVQAMGGSPALPPVACPAGGLTVVAVPEQGGCVATDAALVNVGCDVGFYSFGLQCVVRNEDGQRLWAFGNLGSISLVSGYSLCADKLPSPCFASTCATPPELRRIELACPLKDVVGLLNCGAAGSEFDANCCSRSPCVGDDDCAPGERCQQVGTLAGWTCGLRDNGCACSGTAGGPPRLACVPAL